MIALISGESGFIGHKLSQTLRRKGWTVCSLTDPASGQEADIRDEQSVGEILKWVSPDVVYHLAGVSGPMLAADRPAEVVSINCEGTVNIVNHASRLGIKRLVYAASVSGYATGTAGKPEPDSIYATTKRYGELVIDYYRRHTSLNCTSVRVGSVYGPGRQTANPIHSMIDGALNDGLIRCNPTAKEPIIWVRDCARLLAGLANAGSNEPSYDAVTETVTHREIAEAIASLVPARIVEDPKPASDYPAGFDVRPLAQAAGVAPSVGLREGVARLVALARRGHLTGIDTREAGRQSA